MHEQAVARAGVKAVVGGCFEANEPGRGTYLALGYERQKPRWRVMVLIVDENAPDELPGHVTYVTEDWLVFGCTRLSREQGRRGVRGVGRGALLGPAARDPPLGDDHAPG